MTITWAVQAHAELLLSLEIVVSSANAWIAWSEATVAHVPDSLFGAGMKTLTGAAVDVLARNGPEILG